MGGPAEPSTLTGMPMNIPGENEVSVWCPPSCPADPSSKHYYPTWDQPYSCFLPSRWWCLVLWNSRVYTTNLRPLPQEAFLDCSCPHQHLVLLSSHSPENLSPTHPFLHQVSSLGITSTLPQAPQEQGTSPSFLPSLLLPTVERSTGWTVQEGSRVSSFPLENAETCGPAESLAGRKMLRWMVGNPTLPAQDQGSREPLPQSALNPVGRLRWALLSLQLLFFSSASYSSRLRSEGLGGIPFPPSSRSLLLPYAGQPRSPFLHQPCGLTMPRPVCVGASSKFCQPIQGSSLQLFCHLVAKLSIARLNSPACNSISLL